MLQVTTFGLIYQLPQLPISDHSKELVKVGKIIMKFYAVVRGRNPGVYTNLKECQDQVSGFSNNHYKAFNSKKKAQDYLEAMLDRRPIALNKQEHKQNPPAPLRLGLIRVTKLRYTIYTDGACKNNQARRNGASRAGYGVYWGANDPRNYSGRVRGEQTNQRAELFAIYHAISEALTIAKQGSGAKYYIYSDSQYAINCLSTWILTWKQNGYRNSQGDPVVNQDLIKACSRLATEIREYGGDVFLMKVCAHSGNENNDIADRLAQEGCFKD